MPNYYNPYNFFPVTYPAVAQAAQPANYQAVQAQNAYPAASPRHYMEWVEGEVGAKAFQKPDDLPPNQPIPLWDSTDTMIYLKSWSPMGIPNPMQKLPYTMPDAQNAQVLQGSGAVSGDFATKDDINSLREEIKGLRESMINRKNQNGSNNQGNGQFVSKGGNNNA